MRCGTRVIRIPDHLMKSIDEGHVWDKTVVRIDSRQTRLGGLLRVY